MRQHVERQFGFLKTTAIGGIVFLLPLIVVAALLAQAGQIVWTIVEFIQSNETAQAMLPNNAAGYAITVAIAIGSLVAICFLCGILATRSLGRWFSSHAERYLLMLFPRYAVFKEQLAGNLGGTAAGGQLRPVRVRMGPVTQLGMEVERTKSDEVIVYLPGAPDPWSGRVVIVPSSEVERIETDPGEFMATFEKLGRGTAEHAS